MTSADYIFIGYMAVMLGFCVWGIIRVYVIMKEIKRLQRAINILKRIQRLPISKDNAEKVFEILRLLEDVPSDFALVLATEEIERLEAVA